MSDIEIARKANLKPISEIGERLDVPKKSFDPIWLKQSQNQQ